MNLDGRNDMGQVTKEFETGTEVESKSESESAAAEYTGDS